MLPPCAAPPSPPPPAARPSPDRSLRPPSRRRPTAHTPDSGSRAVSAQHDIVARGRAGGSVEGVRGLCRAAEERLEGCGAEGDAIAVAVVGARAKVVRWLRHLWAFGFRVWDLGSEI